jgi:hypothetical protein
MEWFKKAADRGSADAQFRIGTMYADGKGVPQNPTEAQKCFLKASAQGSPELQYSLGSMYFHGNGVTKDHTEAMKWFRKAADQDHAKAQYSLGTMYFHGNGVTKDHTEAMKWFEKAAARGDLAAHCIITRNAVTPPNKESSSDSKAPGSKHTSSMSDSDSKAPGSKHTLSMSDNGSAWKAASRDKRIELCREIGYGTGLTNDYKYWLYNIDDCYRTPETLELSIQLVVDTIKMQILINERQKYLGR